MRRSGHADMAEKRVLLQSIGKKNSLARIYRKVNLEEKSFMSTSQFDKRLLLNKHEKFRQLRSQQNGQKTSMYQRNHFPRVPCAIPRLYPSSLTNPKGIVLRKGLETPGGRKLDLEFGKKHIPKAQVKPSMGVIHKISDPSLLEENFKISQRSSTENLFKNRVEPQQSNQKSSSRSKAYMVENFQESRTNRSSVVNVGDIIRYVGYDRRGWQNGGKAGEEKNGEMMGIHSEVTLVQQSKNPENISPRKQNSKQNPQVSITFEENSSRHPNEETDNEHEKISKPTDKKKDIDRPNSSSKTTKSSLPSLCILRRGSVCDVKTFTSGRVLDDLLSNLEEPTTEKKSNYLDAEDLKYCRYLRSATPSEDGRDGLEKIPSKYQPSSNIIIGHTKVSLQ